jgi:hypothetical protein
VNPSSGAEDAVAVAVAEAGTLVEDAGDEDEDERDA